MSYQWTAPDFKSKLVTQIRARIGIANFDPEVKVLTYSPSIDEPHTDVVVIGAVYQDTENEPVAIGGNRYDEEVNLRCGIRVVRPGAGEDVSEAAEERATEILAEVTDEVQSNWPTVGDQTKRARVTNREADLRPYQPQGGVPVRVCEIEFSIVYSARTSPGGA